MKASRYLTHFLATRKLAGWDVEPKKLGQNNSFGVIHYIFPSIFFCSCLGFMVGTQGAIAQSIIPANDGTQTIVNQAGNHYNITGGQLSSDQLNLFHSFQQFGVPQNGSANFLTSPQIQNIFSRVTGGQASIINGLLQVSGGPANLFLINPAGIIFGSQSQLNVAGDFHATTATSLKIGEGWLNATGNNQYAQLVGSPSAFIFNNTQPGSILNFGQLAVNPGQNLNLVAGTIVSQGGLSAPGGTVNLVSVAGGQIVEISQTGHLLKLEVPINSSNASLPITPLSLPELLSVAGENATGLTVNNQGKVQLVGSGFQVQNGDIVAKNITAHTANLNAQNNLTLVESQMQTTGNLNLIGLNSVQIRDTDQHPFIANAGGNLYIQGNQKIDIFALNNPQTDIQSGGNLTLVSDGVISGDSHFVSQGNFSILNLAGGAGTFISLEDPIIKSGQDVVFGNYTGAALKIEAEGNITLGNVLITSPDSPKAIPVSDPDFVILTTTPSLLLNSKAGSVTVGNVDTSTKGQGNAGQTRITALNNITTGNIVTKDQGSGDGGNVTLASKTGNITVFGSIDASDQASGNAGKVSIKANQGSIEVQGGINVSEQGPGDSGTVTLVAGKTISYQGIDQSEQGPGNPATSPIISPNQSENSNPGNNSGNNPGNNPGNNNSGNNPGNNSGNNNSGNNPGNNPGNNNSGNNSGNNSSNNNSGNINPGGSNPGNTPTEGSSGTQEQGDNAASPRSSQNGTNADRNSNAVQDNASPSSAVSENTDTPTVLTNEQWLQQSETDYTQEFLTYLGRTQKVPTINLDQARKTLVAAEQNTGIKPALVYVRFVTATQAESHKGVNSKQSPYFRGNPSDRDHLEILVVTAEGEPIRRPVPNALRSQVLRVAREFRSEVTSTLRPRGYLTSAQQLYRWIVTPIEGDLQERKIQNIVFLMDSGLRSIPMAAFHDGNKFLVEKYSLGLMPSLTLTDTRYRDIKPLEVLAMGASQFSGQTPLPAVPIELSLITSQLWPGKAFLNDDFTLENLKFQRQIQNYGIVHLATHGEFKAGAPNSSYLQLWDQKLYLDQLPKLSLNSPQVELLVLSACQTALGDREAELGFAGLSVQAGTKSSLGSLWYVSDEGTLGLMTEFYNQLRSVPMKAEALRQAQIAMINQAVYLEKGQLRTSRKQVSLPSSLSKETTGDLSHPFYWAAFTMIGSPW